MGDLALDQDQHYVHSHLTRAEDRLPPLKNSNVVYRIPCACGKMYIGETIRRYGMHVDEHRDACITHVQDCHQSLSSPKVTGNLGYSLTSQYTHHGSTYMYLVPILAWENGISPLHTVTHFTGVPTSHLSMGSKGVPGILVPTYWGTRLYHREPVNQVSHHWCLLAVSLVSSWT